AATRKPRPTTQIGPNAPNARPTPHGGKKPTIAPAIRSIPPMADADVQLGCDPTANARGWLRQKYHTPQKNAGAAAGPISVMTRLRIVITFWLLFEHDFFRKPAATFRDHALKLAFKRRLVFQAVVAGEPAHQRAAHPVLQNPADVLARNPRHGGDIALAH